MALTDDDKKRLRGLQKETEAAFKKALGAREKLTAAFVACARGQGPGPSDAEIKATQELEQQAQEQWDKLSAVLNFFV